MRYLPNKIFFYPSLVIGLLYGCNVSAQNTTNLYHTNRVFRPVTFDISGTPTAYEVYTAAKRLTDVVGPTNIIVNTNNTKSTEYEAVAWGYSTPEEA